MKKKPRVFHLLAINFDFIYKKFLNFKSVLSLGLCAIFLGFLCGNIFGTFLSIIRNLLFWDGLILSLLLLFVEFLSFIFYKKRKNSFKNLNFFKIGLLLGFYIDAFKVGS